MEGTGVRNWERDRGTQEDLQTQKHIGSREAAIRLEKDYIGVMCREQKRGTNIESS